MARWDWLLEILYDTEMKTWIHDVQAIMQAIDFPFQCSIGYYQINLFHATSLFLYLLKTSENS